MIKNFELPMSIERTRKQAIGIIKEIGNDDNILI